MKNQVLAGCVLVAVLLAGGCSSSTESSSPTTTSGVATSSVGANSTGTDDPSAPSVEGPACDLLTEAQVSEAIGLEVKSKAPTADDLCVWEFAASESGHTQKLVLSVGDQQRWKVRTDDGQTSDYDYLDGVGEKAAFQMSGPSGWATEDQVTAGSATLLALSGASTLEFDLELYEIQRADAVEALSSLAEKALGGS